MNLFGSFWLCWNISWAGNWRLMFSCLFPPWIEALLVDRSSFTFVLHFVPLVCLTCKEAKINTFAAWFLADFISVPLTVSIDRILISCLIPLHFFLVPVCVFDRMIGWLFLEVNLLLLISFLVASVLKIIEEIVWRINFLFSWWFICLVN